MYQIFGLGWLLRYFGMLAVVSAVALVFFSDLQSMTDWFSVLSSAAAIAAALVWVLGQTGIFPWICRRPIARNFFPDIDGRWIGTTDSNWPEIAKRSGLPVPEAGAATPVDVVFKARLLTLTMRLASENKYSESRTISVKVERDKDHGDVKIWCLYENITKKPKETDSERHFGGAYLDYAADSGTPTLDGVYWTNRNWEKAYNTAGRIKLRRP